MSSWLSKANASHHLLQLQKSEMLDMLACLAVVDSTIPQDETTLKLKTPDLRKFNGLKQCIETHCIGRAYCVSIGKLCWKYNEATKEWFRGQGCKSCKQPSIPGPLFNKLSSRRPLNPDPEPTRAHKATNGPSTQNLPREASQVSNIDHQRAW